jgi:hypothetical protein
LTLDGVLVSLGNGDGTFRPTIFTRVKDGGTQGYLAAVDFNGDDN